MQCSPMAHTIRDFLDVALKDVLAEIFFRASWLGQSSIRVKVDMPASLHHAKPGTTNHDVEDRLDKDEGM